MSDTKSKTVKRMSVEDVQSKVKERSSKPDYRGVSYDNIIWDSLRYDNDVRRQVIDIKTVDENNDLDGKIRTIATSDLQHTKHSKDTVKKLQKLRANAARKAKKAQK